MVYKQFPTVAIVILNWNGQHFLARFLPSVITHSQGCTVYVVDNHSSDSSVPYLREQHPDVKLILHPENLGFCEGYNQALRQIPADYYVLLNSDVEVTAGWVTPIISLLENDTTIAACQPKLKSYHQRQFFEYAGAGGGLLDRLGYPFCRGRLFNFMEKDEGQYNDTRPVFWASGACLFVRAAAYHQAGGLEPAFFAHMEEIDLCWRFQNQGYKVMYCGQSEVYHVGGGTLPKSNPHKTFLNFRNGLALVYKNIPEQHFYTVFFTRLVLDWVAAAKFLVDGQLADSLAVFKAHGAIWQNRNYWKQKRKEQAPLLKTNLMGWYAGSIVCEYFIRGKKKYQDLFYSEGIKT